MSNQQHDPNAHGAHKSGLPYSESNPHNTAIFLHDLTLAARDIIDNQVELSGDLAKTGIYGLLTVIEERAKKLVRDTDRCDMGGGVGQ